LALGGSPHFSPACFSRAVLRSQAIDHAALLPHVKQTGGTARVECRSLRCHTTNRNRPSGKVASHGARIAELGSK
jgi:hypothetical protein